jgi:hypothetical protein
MSFFMDRRGKISVIRVGTFAALLGVLMIAGGWAAFTISRASFQQPLAVELFPGVEEWGQLDRSKTSRSVFFRTNTATPEEVANHYSQIIARDFADSGETCKRIPFEGNYPNYSPDRRDVVPYEFRCLFIRSDIAGTHHTIVTIQPGVFDPEPDRNNEGYTVIEHEQQWQS